MRTPRALRCFFLLQVVACDAEDTASPLPPLVQSPVPEAGSVAPDAGAQDATMNVPDAGADAMPIVRRPLAVDTTNPKLTTVTFKANQADTKAVESLGTQGGYLDTRVKPVGKLVVFLHGAGAAAPASCTNTEVASVLTAKGFHVFLPCYNSYYGVGACGSDIGGCRREAFEGKDVSPVISIAPSDAIEPRIVAAMTYLAGQNPGGDWSYFLHDGQPYWPDIIIAGISHGASSAGLIAKIRPVDRAVMLSGPLDTNQAWLGLPSLTPSDRIFGFTHTLDTQHAGHLAAFETMKLPGVPTTVDGVAAPYGGTHRLMTSAMPNPNTAAGGHGSTAPGNASPKAGSTYVFAPVWATLFGR